MIVYQHHIMWYESKMISETLDSLQQALDYFSPTDFKFVLCLNSQTYLEKPIEGTPTDMLLGFINHPVLKGSRIIYKTEHEPFYNIGDWRREQYYPEAKYTVWGESDCLLPKELFFVLENVNFPTPHILTFSSRKMWDSSWDCVEHKDLLQYKRISDINYGAPQHLNSHDVITQKQLNDFNEGCENVEIVKLPSHKIDGSLVCISGDINQKFIPDEVHFVREDTCFEKFCIKKGIPQYHATNLIKGHNYAHPLKRTNTNSKRTDDLFKKYSEESSAAVEKFLISL